MIVFMNNEKVTSDGNITVETKKDIFKIIKMVKSIFTLLLKTLSSLKY